MPIHLTLDGLKKIFPRAPIDVINAFVAKQDVLDKAGITHTRTRLGYFFANIEHECGGFGLKGLTENINYTAERAAQIWPSRFKSADAVRAKFGGSHGWQLKMFDDVYGSRMGNRPGTNDGSTYIGRGGPQWTGRDGYRACGRIAGIPAEHNPQAVSRLDMQPEVCTAFWSWKNLNRFADAGDFKGCRKAWNGGHIGIADVEEKLRGNDPLIKQLLFVGDIAPTLKDLPGAPPTPDPPKDVVDAATANERNTRNGATAGAVASTGVEVGNVTAKEPVVSPMVTYAAIGVCVAIVVIASIAIARKKRKVKANWV